MSFDVAWVDIALLAILVLSVLVGLVRGFVFEVMSLVGWLAAWLAAQWFSVLLAPHLPIGEPGSMPNHAAAFVITFVLALVVWSLLARLVRMLIHATPLSLVDRLLGALFGALRGGVVLLALATIVGLTPWKKTPAWQASTGAEWLDAALQGLRPLLPPSLSHYLRS